MFMNGLVGQKRNRQNLSIWAITQKHNWDWYSLIFFAHILFFLVWTLKHDSVIAENPVVKSPEPGSKSLQFGYAMPKAFGCIGNIEVCVQVNAAKRYKWHLFEITCSLNSIMISIYNCIIITFICFFLHQLPDVKSTFLRNKELCNDLNRHRYWKKDRYMIALVVT